MVKLRYWILIGTISCIAGCLPGSDEATQTPASLPREDQQTASWRERYLELGRETYEEVCASCHDEGVSGSPAKGNRNAWADRSPLWSAVLIEHAKTGYLNMPTKGGQHELSNNDVQAAGEYMLSETFPELPRD